MRFRLVPNSVTLDDLEWRNSPNRQVISPNSVAFGPDYIKVIEDSPTPVLSTSGNVGKKSSFWRYITYGDIGRGSSSAKALKWGTPLSLAKIWPIISHNLETVKQCKIEGEFVLITNRKSYMSFRLVPKSVTLNDLERRNGRYIASFHWIW